MSWGTVANTKAVKTPAVLILAAAGGTRIKWGTEKLTSHRGSSGGITFPEFYSCFECSLNATFLRSLHDSSPLSLGRSDCYNSFSGHFVLSPVERISKFVLMCTFAEQISISLLFSFIILEEKDYFYLIIYPSHQQPCIEFNRHI